MVAHALAPLDYDKAQLRISVSTPIEQQFRAFPAKKEPWTVAFIESMKRGDVLWDVGANVGSYSLIAAARGNDVVAIEPGAANFRALLDNMHRNRLQGVILALNVALGATTEKIPFPQQASPGYGEGGGLNLEVQQVTMDDLVFGTQDTPPAYVLNAPTHIKIDVDGHELGVLNGAFRTLTQSACRALLVEVKLSLGERVSDLMAMWGWTRTAIHDKRKGQTIPGIRYEEFRR